MTNNEGHGQTSDFDSVKEAVDRGRLGLNKGISMGYPKLDRIVGGVQKSRFDLVFAKPKAGKSAFVHNSYILSPYRTLLKEGKTKDLKVFLFSLEVSKKEVLAKWICSQMYEQSGGRLLISPSTLMGKKLDVDGNPVILSEEYYHKFLEHKEYFDKMQEDCVTIYDEACNPTKIFIIVKEFMEKNGKWVEGRYVPNNPNLIVEVIVDTAGNIKWEKVDGITSMKTTIDKMSEYFRYLRNSYDCSPVMVMHSNRDLDDPQREKVGDIFPKTSDIKETSQPIQDELRTIIYA